ncbi:hypothetical protein Tco_0239912, partial [Tanacetum coccineum]
MDEILKKFSFSTMRIASTPMETLKPLLKDAEAEDVDVHLYRSMIGSLMYLTSSRPDIIYFIASFILLIMEYLVNIRKRRAFWSLNEDILKITILKTNTPYPSRKIQRIRACTHQRPRKDKDQYA